MGEVQSPNILNWYPFKENQKIKEIKKNKEKFNYCFSYMFYYLRTNYLSNSKMAKR